MGLGGYSQVLLKGYSRTCLPQVSTLFHYFIYLLEIATASRYYRCCLTEGPVKGMRRRGDEKDWDMRSDVIVNRDMGMMN